MVSATDQVTAVAHPTVADPWQPRAPSWLSRRPSRFASQTGRPLFIGGCPRSGTTLLRSLVDNHPDLAMPAETQFVLEVYAARERYGDLRRPEARRAIAEWLFYEDGHGGRRLRVKNSLSREAAVERVMAAPPTLGSLFATCFRIYAEAYGKPRWGAKRPAYAPHVRDIFRLFPDAQFVNVIRDPRASVASQVKLRWYRECDRLENAIATWETAVQRLDAFAGRLRLDQLLDVRYEDLVRDPRRALRAICEFAGLRTGEAVEEMIASERIGIFREGWHDRLKQPIDTTAVDAWRTQLGPRKTALVERATGAYFTRFGYRGLPGLDAPPAQRRLRALELQREHRARRYREWERAEVKRRWVTHRHPVAAPRGAGATPPAR
jgi:hypothetical protein